MAANKENITRVTRDEARLLKDETDYARLDAMTDDDIARAVASDPTMAPLDIDWDKASIVIPPGKDIITLRLDRDILEWLRAQGKGYQTLINQVLRAFYDAQIKRARREKIAVASQKAAAKRKAKKAVRQAPRASEKARLTMYASTSILEGQMNNELIDALEALLEAAPDADSLRVLVGQATANRGPMSAEEFIAFARELLDAARKADQTA